jgi:HEAT repeat protein
VTPSEAIDFLRAHQPMPPDTDLTDELIGRYNEARQVLRDHPDDLAIPLLLNSFGDGNGFGVYQLVDDTLRAYDRDRVVETLERSLRSALSSVRLWSIDIALEYPDARLIPPVVDLLSSADRDIRYFAVQYLINLEIGPTDVGAALLAALQVEQDEEIRAILSSATQSLR